ncbi:MAG: N-acetylmuramoyl-L-alanine amidase, partial [Gemmatimonadaceae bacterium]
MYGRMRGAMRGARWHALVGAVLMALVVVPHDASAQQRRRRSTATRAAKKPVATKPVATKPVATATTASTAAAKPAPKTVPKTVAASGPADSSATNGREKTAPLGRRRMVVVDAGHGGVDHGMSGPIGAARKIFEKDITLAVAQQLRTALEARGIGVLMTRATDTLIALGDRGRIANQGKGDLFVSVHVNAANLRWNDPGAARGYETYFLAEAKTEDERRVEAMENEVIK